MPTVIKTQFTGGIDQFHDPSQVDFAAGYVLGVNCRTRNGKMESIQAPRDITASLPAGKRQGIYTFGNFVVAFVSGKAYYATYAGDVWNEFTGGFAMSETVDRIYAELIPASSINFLRMLSDASDVGGSSVKLSIDSVFPSPRCIICCDGENQPWLLVPDGSSRVTKNYDQWSKEDPEYVPIGIMPMYHPDGILYMVMRDKHGNWTQIVRSVSGMPINFVIKVNSAGEKHGTEEESGALALAHHVSYNDITCLKLINSPDSSFFVGTSTGSYLVFPDYNDLIFAEPKFKHQSLFPVGPLNQFCVVDIGGDTALICSRGIRSFNGTREVRALGKNDPFSLPLTRVIDGITQQIAAAIEYDNYVVFALQTKFGAATIWYDTLLKAFVSLDFYDGVAEIKQFAVTQTNDATKLWFITTDERVYEAFSGDNTLEAGIYPAERQPTKLVDGRVAQHRLMQLTCTFVDTYTEGTCTVQMFNDSQIVAASSAEMLITRSATTSDEPLPYLPSTVDNVSNVSFDFGPYVANGHSSKVGAWIRWSAKSSLISIQMSFEEIFPARSIEYQAGMMA